MKRLVSMVLVVFVLATALSGAALAAADDARVRVVHASPDAPAVDVLVNGQKAFSNAPFKAIADYVTVKAGTYKAQVVPTGATTPVVIDATLDLKAGTDYTVVALGKLANVAPLVLVDNNAAPAAGKAHVRFVHASPDAPAVDIAVKGGPVIFKNVAFKGVGDYTPVDANTYDLEVRLAGTNTVALAVPGVKLEAGKVYTVFAMGLAGGQPALTAVSSVDASYSQGVAAALPKAGESNASLMLAGILAAVVALMAGLALRFAPAAVRNRK